MRHEQPFRIDLRTLKQRAAMARLGAGRAMTTQERLHLEGMAAYWEELLKEQEVETPN